MRRRTLPLMEELVMTLVFALAAAICLRAFALADGISRRSALRDALLRQADDDQITRVFSETYPESGVGLAVMNRMARAAGFDIVQA